MKQLEIIQLRLAGNDAAGLVEDIRRSIGAESEKSSVRIYRHATVASDLGIHIHLEADGNGACNSDLGLRLASALREHGMVEHTVWRDATPSNQSEGGEGHGEY